MRSRGSNAPCSHAPCDPARLRGSWRIHSSTRLTRHLSSPCNGASMRGCSAGGATHYVLLYYLLLTTHHSPLTAPHSPLTTHHSPLTTHHSLLTTHHSLQMGRPRQRLRLRVRARWHGGAGAARYLQRGSRGTRDSVAAAQRVTWLRARHRRRGVVCAGGVARSCRLNARARGRGRRECHTGRRRHCAGEDQPHQHARRRHSQR